MASKSWEKFDENFEDIERLVDLGDIMSYFDKEGGEDSDKDDLDKDIDVLYRAAVVLMVSHWEAYVENICSEALSALVENVNKSDDLPKEIKKQVANEIKETKNEIEIWKIADDGWKKYLREKLLNYKEVRDRSFNTPKSAQTEEFVNKVVGLPKITESWVFDDFTAKKSKEKLDNLIEIRGQIAHRGKLGQKISKEWLLCHVKFLRKIVSKTGGKINMHIKKATGQSLW